ncbi:MAG TPA: MBL fold metallo-hydrolase [Longimicrobiaceae bacterium]|nr:MBL fold metallo-hydrolase [Longimicrobiaceae bacterium]
MPTLHLLGTGAALSDASRTTTMLAFESAGSAIVVDCGGDVVQRLMAAGIDPDRIEALVVTHEHADHVSGFPLFMEKVWLAGRRRPVPVHGPAPALSQARRIWEAFDTGGWEGVPEILWREVALEEGAVVLESDAWHVTAAPGTHSVPVIGVRVEDRRGSGVAAYSCDTEESDAIARLARGADLLVHEATGGFGGHTSVEGAARVAARAEAGRLVLVHLPPEVGGEELARARETFPRVELGEDGARYEF